MRYRAADIARLGEGAKRQIAAFRFALAAQGDQLAGEVAKKSKYGAKRVTVDGKWFASKAEANRYLDLRQMHRKGVISELVCQPAYPVEINGVHICTYFADFEYCDENGKRIIEDVKSEPTRKLPLYRLKRKLVEVIHGITVTEIMT